MVEHPVCIREMRVRFSLSPQTFKDEYNILMITKERSITITNVTDGVSTKFFVAWKTSTAVLLLLFYVLVLTIRIFFGNVLSGMPSIDNRISVHGGNASISLPASWTLFEIVCWIGLFIFSVLLFFPFVLEVLKKMDGTLLVKEKWFLIRKSYIFGTEQKYQLLAKRLRFPIFALLGVRYRIVVRYQVNNNTREQGFVNLLFAYFYYGKQWFPLMYFSKEEIENIANQQKLQVTFVE